MDKLMRNEIKKPELVPDIRLQQSETGNWWPRDERSRRLLASHGVYTPIGHNYLSAVLDKLAGLVVGLESRQSKTVL